MNRKIRKDASTTEVPARIPGWIHFDTLRRRAEANGFDAPEAEVVAHALAETYRSNGKQVAGVPNVHKVYQGGKLVEVKPIVVTRYNQRDSTGFPLTVQP